MPAMPKTGLGMNVQCRPCSAATALSVYLKRHRVVGGGQRVVVLEVNLVLAGADLVVRGLDLDAHRLPAR